MKQNSYFHNLYGFVLINQIFLIFYVTNMLISQALSMKSSSNKSFIDLAKEEFIKSNDQENYTKEAASLNPEYYTKKGMDELNICRVQYISNYERCKRFKTCNFCDANSGCGWCNEKRICVPTEYNSSNNEMVPICQGECVKLLKIEYCYKGLFEPEITEHEINFSNYKDVLDESNEKEIEEENIFEKELERNFLKARQTGKLKNTNTESHNKNFNFKQKEASSKDRDCEKPITNDSPAETNLTDDLNIVANHPSLNYIPNAFTNKPNEIDLDHSRKVMLNKMKEISKNVFTELVEGHLHPGPRGVGVMLAGPNPENKNADMMKYLKEFVPNFEFPQYARSDLEDSIDKIKKEKLLLWLRGYSLNEDISKRHLPIYKDLTFVNEDDQRKMLLDKFYRDILKENSQKILSEKIKDMKKDGKYYLPVSRINTSNDITMIPEIENPIEEIKLEKTNSDTLKKITVINSKFIDKNDLVSIVKKNNMRFKQKYSEDNSNITQMKNTKKIKSFKEISDELKNLLKMI